jgi:hypothetical protein
MEPLQTFVGVDAFGARIAIRAPESIASGLSLRLPPRSRAIASPEFDVVYTVQHAAAESECGSTGFEVSRDGEAIGRFATLDDARFELESSMDFQVAIAARGFLFVHAGVVAQAGRAIVIPGRTLAGKSTLVMALVRAGATYFSDEYAVIDSDGLVHPYRRPLSERVEEQALPRLHSPESLGAGGDTDAVPLGLTVITRYRPSARWDPVSVSSAQALMALFDNTVVAREQPAFSLELLSNAVENTWGIEGDRSEADEVALDILKRESTRPGYARRARG